MTLTGKLTDKQKGLIFAFIALFSWGIHGPAGRYLALNKVDMYFVTAARFWMGTVVFFCFLLINKNLKLNFKDNWKLVLLLSLVGLVMNSVLYHLTLIFLPATLVMILENLAPVFVLLMSFIFLKILPRKYEIVALVLSFSGLILITLSGNQNLSDGKSYLIGIILGILTGLTFGVYTFFSAKLVTPIKDKPQEIIRFLFKIFLIGSVFMLPVLFRRNIYPSNGRQWFWLCEMGIFQSGVSYLFWNFSLRYLSANTVSILFLFTIIFTTINEMLFLSLSISLPVVSGSLMIIASGYILSRNSGTAEIPTAVTTETAMKLRK